MAGADSSSLNGPPSTLKNLLAQTRKLQSTVASTSLEEPLPNVHLGLDQIETQSRRLRSRASHYEHHEAAPSLAALGGSVRDAPAAHYLLAGGGINADEWSRDIRAVDLKGTFEPLQPLHDADLEGYLRHEHEQSIIFSVEEGRRQTAEDFYLRLDDATRKEWARQREQIFEELRRRPTQPPASSSRPRERQRPFSLGWRAPVDPSDDPTESSGTRGRMLRYESAIARFNRSRRDGTPSNVGIALGEACSTNSAESAGSSLVDTWRLVSVLCGEVPEAGHQTSRTCPREGAYKEAYAGGIGSPIGLELRARLVCAARTHLQEQFMQYVTRQLEANPVEAGLGGEPSVSNKIRAFVHLKYSSGDTSDKRLEIVNRTAIWARLFFLLRSGHLQEALVFAHQQEQQISAVDETFITFFTSWVESPIQCLSRAQRDRLCSDYHQRLRHGMPVDPFKLALYKIIGRLDLQRKNAPVAIASVEDWTWFQLMLVHDGQGADFAPPERFTLEDFAAVVSKYGESHFDPNGTRPLTFCRMLLVSGQFEKAVLFLEQKSQYQADAVHFSIVLAYYGLLRVEDAQPGGPDNRPSIHFVRQMTRYAALLARGAPVAALQYLYLICLDSDPNSPQGQVRIEACYGAISDLLVDSTDLTELVGYIREDGSCHDGMLQRDLSLLGVRNRPDFLRRIVCRAAEKSLANKRHEHALALFHIAGEYESVLSTLSIRLSELLQQSPSATESREAFDKARALLSRYDAQIDTRRPSLASKATCNLLLALEQTVRLHRDGHVMESFAGLDQITFLPRGNDLVEIIRKADEAKVLDQAILQNLDFVVLSVMDILLAAFRALKASLYREGPRQLEIENVQTRARALMTWVGMMKYQLRPHTLATLSRQSVYLN